MSTPIRRLIELGFNALGAREVADVNDESTDDDEAPEPTTNQVNRGSW